MSIHSTAIVHPRARLGANVEIGAYSIVGEHVEIADDTWIGPHVVIGGHTRIGRDNRIFQFSSIGEMPQDKKYANEPTRLEIGDRNTIREFCTFNCGTVQDVGVTRLGNDNWIMSIWPTTARSATTPFSPTTRNWPAMFMSATGRYSAASRPCISSCALAPTA
jgi:UDP-N-acetylglucosamine acyltransferase